MIELENKSVLLLSASEYRRSIFRSLSQQYGFSLSFGISGFPEDLEDRACPLSYVQSTAKHKLLTYLGTNPNATDHHDFIISADTILSFNNNIIEKPESHSEAREILQAFKDNKIVVITAACIYTKNQMKEFFGQSAIIMNDYTDSAIDSYLGSVKFGSIAGGVDVDVMLEMGMVKGVEGQMDDIRGFPVQQFLQVC